TLLLCRLVSGLQSNTHESQSPERPTPPYGARWVVLRNDQRICAKIFGKLWLWRCSQRLFRRDVHTSLRHLFYEYFGWYFTFHGCCFGTDGRCNRVHSLSV